MKKTLRSDAYKLAHKQGANALLAATFAFLRRNNIPKAQIIDSVHKIYSRQKSSANIQQYRKLARSYEELGTVMASWYSEPKFMDKDGHPLPLKTGRGPVSVSSLIRASQVKVSVPTAVELMRRSPSISVNARGELIAMSRVFVLPEFEIPRAALVIERYLDTLRKNSSMHKRQTTPLLERSCHVPEIDLTKVAPVLRDIKGRGTAFMDSVDGEIEGHRLRRNRQKGVGEMGVLVFAWTRPQRAR